MLDGVKFSYFGSYVLTVAVEQNDEIIVAMHRIFIAGLQRSRVTDVERERQACHNFPATQLGRAVCGPVIDHQYVEPGHLGLQFVYYPADIISLIECRDNDKYLFLVALQGTVV